MAGCALLAARPRGERFRSRTWLSIAVAVAVAGGAASVWAGTLIIGQAGQVFSAKTLALAVGDVVIFLDDDTVRHNIRILDSQDTMTDVGVQNPGQRLTYTFSKSGKFRVRCGIHPGMKLTVIVQ